MPELPEVETIRRDLVNHITSKQIDSIRVRLPRMLRGAKAAYQKQLRGRKVQVIDRVGKLIIIELDEESNLLVHLKMTGQLIYKEKDLVLAGGHSYGSDTKQYPNKYTYVTIRFIDGSELYFNDMRTFGYMQLATPDEVVSIKAGFGIEPLTKNFTYPSFDKALGKRTTTIKAVLLNQKLIAGIGNIYADEICFDAKVLPDRRVNTLTASEKKALFNACTSILRLAIKHRGTTFNNYVDSYGKSGSFTSFLKVYGRAGDQCARCRKGIIQKTRVAGRGTHFCSNCQK
ncbi:MAG: bifunctional DNA-formamidopyrimidine glycosylase/DNA-(apurinic or apyrimidinic site) lyase [Patescibacteria group bacterium]